VYLDSRIEANREKVQRLKESAEGTTSNLSPNKVQTSTSKQKMADAVISYADLEKTIQADEEKKQGIIDTISLLNPYESTVLYKRYVEDKSLWVISREMKKSYSWATKVHSTGIKNIQKIINEKAEG
jgi:DNA-directed RNA polymerase specialized sigma subunit